jgi:peroxiredoxin
MKKIVFSLMLVSLFSIAFTQSKSLGKLPNVEVKTPSGETVNMAELSNDGNPIIISFWALWCHPCMKELTTISEEYDDWVEETGVKLYAVSVDDARSSSRVMPTANGKGWDFEILLDPNSDFKRAMNVGPIPHTFVINGKGEIVWEHTSFTEGSELELIDVIRKVKAGKDVSH